MVKLVLDCSVTISWLLKDEQASVTDKLLINIRDNGAIVPSIWLLEVSNVLLNACKRERISYIDVKKRFALLKALPIIVEQDVEFLAFNEIFDLAFSEGLTSYDACYLEIAIRKGLPLATQDKVLKKVAKKMEVQTLP